MAGLEGTIKTPIGPVQKKTALLLGGGVVVIGAIVWYRQRQMGSESTPTEQTEINPATGYPYGSAEDAAALAAQAAYVSPPASSGGGSSNVPPSNLSFSSNGQWTQAVIEYMITNSLLEDTGAMSAALGKYLTGAYVTDAQVSLIQQAIAVQGFPPIAGANGYPPSLNRNAPASPANPTTTLKAPTGLRIASKGQTTFLVDWNKVEGANGYKVKVAGGGISKEYFPLDDWDTIAGLKKNTKYTITVNALTPSPRKNGPTASITATTNK